MSYQEASTIRPQAVVIERQKTSNDYRLGRRGLILSEYDTAIPAAPFKASSSRSGKQRTPICEQRGIEV
jgi:hypothetical protein